MGYAFERLQRIGDLSRYIDGNFLLDLTRSLPDKLLNNTKPKDAGVFWNIISVDGWRIEEHKGKGIYRILDRDKICRSYGNESTVIQPILNEVERRISEEQNTPSNVGINVPEELRKYKELCDDGIITEDEFKRKKKELLGF